MDLRFTFGLFHIHQLNVGKNICWGFDFFTFNLKSLLALWVDDDGVGVDLFFTHWQVWERPNETNN